MPGYPIELDLRGRLVVVVGLGAVGRRKAEGLAVAGARVLAIDPMATEIPPGVDLITQTYRAEHLVGSSLAFASATAEVNHRVVADARALGIWVNSASDPSGGNFTLPATWRDGPLTLTVSTSGASPALAAALRDRAALALGSTAAILVQLLAELRPEVLETTLDPQLRRQALALAADPRWLDLIAREGTDSARSALRNALGLGDPPSSIEPA